MAAIHFSARTKSVLIWAGLALALGFVYLHGALVTPFLWALVTAFILNAVVQFAMHRLGGPRGLWVVIIYFGLVAGLIWLLMAVVPVFGRQIRDLAHAVPNYVDQVDRWLEGTNIQILGVSITSQGFSESIRKAVNDYLGGLSSRAPEFVLTAFERLLNLLLYLVATFYILLEADRIVLNIRSLFPSDVLAELDPWIRRVTATLAAYLRGQAVLILIITGATSAGLQILGVQFALALGVMSGIVETVPYLGPYAAGAIATLVAVTQTQPNHFGWPPLALGIAVAVMYTVIRQVEDNLIMPFVIGRTVALHPLTVIFVVLAGASLGGVLGLLLAVPAAATLKIVLEFLWLKIKAPDPRETLAVGPNTSWDTIARRVGAAQGERLLLIVPGRVPIPALLEVADYQRLAALAMDRQLSVGVVTDDAAAAARAHAAGLVVDLQPPAQFAHTALVAGVDLAALREPPAPRGPGGPAAGAARRRLWSRRLVPPPGAPGDAPAPREPAPVKRP